MRNLVSSTREKERPPVKAFLGCDTETYYDGSNKGLRSIQIAGDICGLPVERLFTAHDYRTTDLFVRLDICRQFFDWMETIRCDVDVAFFNIDFDASQFILYLCQYSGYQFVYGNSQYWGQSKGTISILESEQTMYAINIRMNSGYLLHMMDLANFLPGSSLDAACRSWLGKSKIALDSKVFPKSRPEGIEAEYSMEDARLTYELFMKLKELGVIENQRTVTIAGRTMRHFQEYLRTEWGCTFDEFFYPGLSREEVDAAKFRIESVMRSSVRGGITMAVHSGMFHHCKHIDARSMYPTQCVKSLIPVGELLDEPPNGPYITLVCPAGFFNLQEGKIPYFQWRSHWQCDRYHWMSDYEPGEYVRDCYLDGSLVLWGDEWEIIQESYEGHDVEIMRTYYFRAVENRALAAYVRTLYEGKRTSTGSKRLYYKILLNALYGKFLSRPDGTIIEYHDGKRVKVEETDRRTYYLPLGSWIAMGGRVQLYRAMSSIPVDDVLYCDTDSIIYKGTRDPEAVLGDDLGMWSLEGTDLDVWIVGPKAYQERNPDGSVITRCAGMPRDVAASMTFGTLEEGLTVECRKPKRDPLTLAINIEPTTYTVSTRAQIFRSR